MSTKDHKRSDKSKKKSFNGQNTKCSPTTFVESVVPVILRFLANQASPNWSLWIQSLAIILQDEFGRIGDFPKTGKLYKAYKRILDAVIEESESSSSCSESDSECSDIEDEASETHTKAAVTPAPTDPPPPPALTKKAKRKQFLKDNKAEILKCVTKSYVESKKSFVDVCSRMFSRILQLISIESLQALESTPQWEKLERNKNPLHLFNALRNIHWTGFTAEGPLMDESVQATYEGTKQRPRESLLSYKKNLIDAAKQFVEIGMLDPGQASLIYRFKKGLDPRYADAVADIELRIKERQFRESLTLQKWYEMLINRVPDTEALKMMEPALATAFTTRVDPKRDKKNKKQPDKKKKAEKTEKSKTPAKQAAHEESDEPPHPCNLCAGHLPDAERMHWRKDCPYMREFNEFMSKKLPAKGKKNQHVNIAIGETAGMFAALSDPVHNAFQIGVLTRDHMAYDNCANVCIVCNRKFVTNIRPLAEARTVRGVGGVLHVTQCADLKHIGTVLFHPQAGVNAISHYQVMRKRPILDPSWDKASDVWTIVNTEDGVSTQFRPTAGVSACHIDDFFASQDDSSASSDSDSSSDAGYSSDDDDTSSNSDEYRSAESDSNSEDDPPPDMVSESDSDSDSDLDAVNQITESEFKSIHPKRVLQKLQDVRDLSRRLGYPSTADLAEMVKRGIDGSNITAADVYRADRLLGRDPDIVKGKTTKQKSDPLQPEYLPKLALSDQTLHSDIMFVWKVAFLISVAVPLNLTLCTHLPLGKGAASLERAFQHQFGMMAAQGFKVKTVTFDGESAIAPISDQLRSMGAEVDQRDHGRHVEIPERKQRVIKERIRCIIVGLWFTLSKALVVMLVYFAVSRINMGPSRLIEHGASPRESFLGRKMTSKDIPLQFGQLVLVHEENTITNTMAPRAQEAIAVLPLGNLSGSCKFFTIKTHRFITRAAWTKVEVIPDWVRENLNALAKADEPQLGELPDMHMERAGVPVPIPDGGDPAAPAPPPVPTPRIHMVPVRKDPTQLQDPENLAPVPGARVIPDPVAEKAHRGGVRTKPQITTAAAPDPIAPPSPPAAPPFSHEDADINNTDPPAPDPGGAVQSPEVPAPPPEPAPVPQPQQTDLPRRYPQRGNRTSFQERAYNIMVKKALKKYGRAALQSMIAEIQQLVDKDAITPQPLNKLSKQQLREIISSHMFLKEKFSSTGEFEKLKARLVAGGHMQDKSIYEENDISSPTVSTSAAFMVATIAAKERRSVATVDITGAYLNAPMSGHEVLMRLDKTMTDILLKIRPDYLPFRTDKGTMIVRLDKALYGCIESAKLWYNDLSSTLATMGYVRNPSDMCVFNRMYNGVQCTICLHVDDLLITCSDDKGVEDTIQQLTDRYKTITVHRGKVHSYLGMTLDFSTPGKVRVSMEKYVTDMLSEYEIKGSAATPATSQLFELDPNSPLLPTDQAERFHSRVAKILYLAKRARPDTLTTIAFLTTRVKAPTQQDWDKLERLLKYINGTASFGIVLQADKDICVLVWVDASYGVHADGKSHTGICISLGRGAVFVKSGKQRLVTKSSTEAELVGLSDSLTQTIWTRDFLIHQGYNLGPATVHQDNMSTIALAEKGRSTSERTRHISIRYFFVKDRIDSGEIKVEYTPTTNMLADVLTKPLQGELFRAMRKQLLNWEE